LTLVVLAILTTALLTACDDNKGGGSCDCKKAQGVVALSSKDYCRNLSNDKGQPISFISTLPQTPTDKVMTEYHSGLNCEGPVIAVE
jgi:hypothetical protein